MGIFRRLFGKRSESPGKGVAQAGASLERERLVRMFERPPSFSLVAFPGDVSADIPDLLSACKYVLRRTGSYRGGFAELYAGLGQPSSANNSIVQKAWYRAAGHTILLDPEMVLITETAQLSRVSEKAGAAVVVAIWERASETVALAEFGRRGLVRQSWYCQGTPSQEQIDSHPEIVERPNSDGLKAALAGYGLHEDAVFGQVDATVVELQE